MSKSIAVTCMSDRNRIYQNGRVLAHLDIQPGPANRQIFFSGQGDACGSNLSFSGSMVNSFHHFTAGHRKPHCKQDERSSPS